MKQDWLAAARAAMEIEAASIAQAATRLDGALIRAVDLILAHPGKVVVTGIGKSGHIARKIVATLCSTGTAAVFLHPAEAVHGDLGIYTPGDPTILISKHGTSSELLALVPLLREFRSPLIGILGSASSPLAAHLDVLLDASVEREADPNNLAPTASAVTALAIGHALAIALMCARNFTAEEFGRFHPGGQLGRNLRLSVREAMHSGEQVAFVAPESVAQRGHHRHDPPPAGRRLRGRDRMASSPASSPMATCAARSPLTTISAALRAADIMTRTPVTIGPDASLGRSAGADGTPPVADLRAARGRSQPAAPWA